MKDGSPEVKTSGKFATIKNVVLLALWVLVGFLGFYLGTKWSSLMEKDQESLRGGRNVIAATSGQTSEDNRNGDTPEWDKVFQMDISIVPKVLQLLREEYIEPTDTKKMVSGAISSMKKKLESKKLKTGMVKPLPQDLPPSDAINYLNKTYSLILTHYGSRISESELTYAALKGLMDSLGDPYSVALEPKEYKLLNEHMSGGNYGGIGIYLELSKDKKKLMVVDSIEGSPSRAQGLKSGDWITKIDQEPTAGMDIEVAARKIRGEAGTTVTLTVVRKGSAPKEYKMTRSLIHVKSVEHHMKPGNIGYIRISFFGNETSVEFSEALENVQNLGAKGLIIDLRNNGGGYISAAIDVCSKLLQSGTLIVSVLNNRTGRREVHKASGSTQIKIPLVVIVNSLSASASEITAGALKDTHTGVLLGVKTFGKGSVQTIHELKDGGALKYTIARYHTPKGTDINKKGIQPDVLVEMEPDRVGASGDVQLERAITYIKERLQAGQQGSK